MLVSTRTRLVRVPSFPARIVRDKVRTAFPPSQPKKPPPFTDLNGAVDPVLFMQLRQRIIERHNPSSAELDEPHIQLVNKNIVRIRQGLKERHTDLIRKSWTELRQANHIHVLTRDVVEQIAQLITQTLLPTNSNSAGWESTRQAFVEEVALAAAAADSTDALYACFIAYLKRGHSKAVLELYEKFRQLPKTQDTPEVLGLDHIEEGIALAPSPGYRGRIRILLSVVAAYAMDNSFQDALRASLEMDIPFHRSTFHRSIAEQFLQSASLDPALQTRVTLYIQRLGLATDVARASSLSKHIAYLSRRPSINPLEELYESMLDAVTGPDAYIAPDAKFVTPTKSVAMSELLWGSFLAAFVKRERKDLAAKLWADMTELGLRPGVSTWNMVIIAYCERGAITEAMGAWNNMLAQGVKPDGTTYRTLMSTLFTRRKFSEAMQWLKTFEAEVKPTAPVEDTLPVYNAVLHGFLQFGQENAKPALSIFKKMEDEGPKPDLVSYNTVLSYHSRQGDFKAMAAVINRMSAAGVTGDVFTFSTILSALLRVGRTDAPAMVLKIMRRQGVKANVATYSDIIQSQMKERSVIHLQAAMQLLHEMEMDRNVAPNEITSRISSRA
ncbi:hypothetical protein DFH06DRAFT_1201102 [Mycena polygramma]|nr:hypothetical protein DFH06DRAFT_1201102 [Mycena polygramma]